MLFLRQSTASQEILLGPFVDSTDGNTQETALTINNTDIKLWAEGATVEFNKTSGGATHIANGRYYAVLDATDTATVGKLEVNVHVTGALAVRREYMVLEEAVYDAMFAASAAGYQVPIWASAGSTVNLSATTVATVTTTTTATTATNVTTVNGLAGNVITAASIASDANTEIAASVWNAARASYTTAGSFGQGVASVQGGVTGSISGDLNGSVFGDVEGEVGTIAVAGLASIADSVWDEVLSGHLTAGTTGNALNSAGSAGDPWGTALPGAYGAGTAGKIIGDNVNATISSRASQTSLDTVDDFLDTEVAAIKAKTDLIPAVPASTTNITAGTITTVTNLTNAPTSGDLTATMKASVNTEVLDVLATDTFAELGAVPAATSSLKDKINWLFALARNKITQTATTQTLRNDADSGSIATSTVSDDGTTFTRGEYS